MQTKFIILFILGSISLFSVSYGQTKYAILIAAEPVPSGGDSQFNGELWPGGDGNDEFWNDIYIAWDMLINKYYFNAANIFTAFADGQDYPGTVNHGDMHYPPRYNPPFNLQISTTSCTKNNVNGLLNLVANQVTPQDFLFHKVFLI